MAASGASWTDDRVLQELRDLLATDARRVAEHAAVARVRELASRMERDTLERVEAQNSNISDESNTRRLDPQLLEQGWFERWLGEDVERKKGRFRDLPPNTVLVDTTTLSFVQNCVEIGEPPSAVGVVDLGNFVENLILRDRIVALQYGLGSQLAQSRPPAATQLMAERATFPGSLDKAVLAGALMWIYQLRSSGRSDAKERRAAVRAWNAILGPLFEPPDSMFAVPPEDALDYLQAYSDSLERSNLSLFSSLIYEQNHVDVPNTWRQEAVQAINCRSLLNLEASRHLGIPYAAGVARTPMKRLHWVRGRRADAMIAELSDPDLTVRQVLDDAYEKRVEAAFSARQQKTALPVFLAAVLARIDRLDQFFDRVDDLRKQATPLRRRIVEIEQALAGSSRQLEINRLFAAFNDDSSLLRRTTWDLLPFASAAAGVVLTAATAQPAWLTASLALLKAPGTLHSTTSRRVVNRLWHRDLWFVTKLATTSKELTAAIPKLEQLWGRHYLQTDFADRLNKLRNLETL
jgi:hypothetical protein